MYANPIPIGKPFDKGKYIEGKMKVLSDMCITPTEREIKAIYECDTPRQIESTIRTIIHSRWN